MPLLVTNSSTSEMVKQVPLSIRYWLGKPSSVKERCNFPIIILEVTIFVGYISNYLEYVSIKIQDHYPFTGSHYPH